MDPTPPPQAPPPDPRNKALIGLALIAALVIGSLLLVHILGSASRLQDCVMSGRTNCAPLDTDAGH